MADKIKNFISEIGIDKICHAAVCYFLMDVLVRRLDISMLIAFAIVCIISFYKEHIDDHFDWADVRADFVGMFLYMI